MHIRLKLLQAASALLYFGPLLAGLGGFGWSQVPGFVVIFVLWLIILRPHQWPFHSADWAKTEALVTLAAQTATQTLLVVVLFGVGRGIGGVFGVIPPVPSFLPIALSFLAIPVCRLIWDPWKVTGVDRFLDHALDQIGGESEDGPYPSLPPQVQLAAKLVEPLLALPDETSDQDIDRHLSAIAVHVDHGSIRQALEMALKDPPVASRARRAVIVHATALEPAGASAGSDYPNAAFQSAGKDVGLLDLFARRCSQALRDKPQIWWDCPQSAVVRERADGIGEPAATSLRQLADELDRDAPGNAAVNDVK